MIRPYRDADRNDIELILRRLDWPEVGIDRQLHTIDRLRDSGPLGVILVYEDPDGAIGFLTGEVHTWAGGGAQIYGLAVSEHHRRSGIGSALLKRFEQFARELRAPEAPAVSIDMPSGDNSAGRAFFDHHGYHLIQERPVGVNWLGGIDISGVTYARSFDIA